MRDPPAPSATVQAAAVLAPEGTGVWLLSGRWTARELGCVAREALATPPATPPTVLDGSGLLAMDSAGVWTLLRWLRQGSPAASPELRGWPSRALGLMQQLQKAAPVSVPPVAPTPGLLPRLGGVVVSAGRQAGAFVDFVGQMAMATLRSGRHPGRLPGRSVLSEIEVGGYQALPIIGLTSFLLGVVVAYQGADQLKHYGANVFVVELVGYAMLREFAPLITAIIIAGRSGSAHAAQIGTMVVTEEIDALRTLGIDPVQRLVLPKMLALLLALPLLTVFADVTGVFGGMVMAQAQLDIGMGEFASRFGSVMQGSALLIGVGKSVVFAWIIVAVGCFQGFRTEGSADSVGRQTTRSVVQSIFLIIAADGGFSVAFNLLDL